MKYQVLFSLINNEKNSKLSSAAVLIGVEGVISAKIIMNTCSYLVSSCRSF